MMSRGWRMVEMAKLKVEAVAQKDDDKHHAFNKAVDLSVKSVDKDTIVKSRRALQFSDNSGVQLFLNTASVSLHSSCLSERVIPQGKSYICID